MNIERLTVISKEIGAWAERNFPVHHPPFGILEEIGEASHCVLKRRQGIRGFDDPGLFKIEFLDALCDLCIYTLHGVALKGIILCYPPNLDQRSAYTDELYLAWLTGTAGVILLDKEEDAFGNEPHAVILYIAEHYARFHGFDLWPELEKVWTKVKSRDWKTNPKDADKKALKKELAYPATPNVVYP